MITRRTDRYAATQQTEPSYLAGWRLSTDTSVTLDQAYYYSLFAFDSAGNYSAVVNQFSKINQSGGGGLLSACLMSAETYFLVRQSSPTMIMSAESLR